MTIVDLCVGAVSVGLMAVAGVGLYVLPGEAERCGLRWKDSGMQSRYETHVGCKVQRKDGTWVPEKSLKAAQS